MKRASILRSALAAGLLLGLTACGSAGATGGEQSGNGPIRVVASTDVWGDLAKTVGGDKVEVTSIIDNPNADPHDYEANARNQLALAKANVIIENGGGYDDFMGRMLTTAGNKAGVVLNAVAISGHAAKGGELNEHVWYDFPTVQKVVQRIQESYTTADPGAAATFNRNAKRLTTQLDELENRELTLKKSYAGQPVSITEPVPLYLLDAIGLVNKTPAAFSRAIEDDTDVSAIVLKQTLDLYAEHRVRLLAYNAQTSGPETERVLAAAKAAGIPAIPVTETLPAGQHYIGWMTDNVKAVGTALGRR